MDTLAPFIPRRLRLVAIVVAVVVLAGFVWLSYALGTVSWDAWTPWDVVWMNALGLALAGAGLRMGLIRATPSEAGLRVRNLFRTFTVPWTRIVGASFNEAAGDAWVSLDLSDGSTAAVMAIQAADGPRVNAEVARLRELIDHYSATPPEA